MRDNFDHLPHMVLTDAEPVSTNVAWIVLLICSVVISGVAGWILHGVIQ